MVTGAADKFSLGFDLRDAKSVSKMGMAERREAQALGPRPCAAREDIKAMTFVAVEGWCVGGGPHWRWLSTFAWQARAWKLIYIYRERYSQNVSY